jgi:hypothetical protein
MYQLKKMWGILAVALIFGLALTGCKNPTGRDDEED